MFFAHLLSVEHLESLLEDMERCQLEELEYIESISEGCASTPGIQFTIDYGHHMVRARI